jgi:hypothetical protein
LQKLLKTTDIDDKGLMVVQTAVWDNRRKVLPTVPKHVFDVHNAVDSVEEHVTNRGGKFVLQNDRTNRMTILGCESNQNQLYAAGIILMDGTFDYCPKFFAQVCTIHCAANKHYVLLVFCLLANTLEDTYRPLFTKTNEKSCKSEDADFTSRKTFLKYWVNFSV